MAATGYTPIYLYYSSTAAATPSAGNLGYGELALNVTDKNLFFKDNTDTVNTVPIRQASGSSNGWLSSTDWTTFNSKQPAGSYLTSVTVDSPLTGAGTSASHLSMPAANGSTNGYLTSTDWTTFNSKQPAGTYVTSVTGTAPVVSSGGTTPAISMAAATSSVNGYLTSTDWTTFNGKQAALGYTPVNKAGDTMTGSLTAPSFIPSGSTVPANGVYLPAANCVGIATNTTNAIYINNSQYVGVNTTTPQSVFSVMQPGNSDSSAATGLGLVQLNQASVSGITSQGGIEFKCSTYGSGYGAKIAALDNGDLVFGGRNNSATWTEYVRIFSNNGVSIGNTTNPGAANLSVNGVIKIGSNQAVNGPAFSAYSNAAQTISNNTYTKVEYKAEEFDTNNNFDSTTNYRFTPTVAGYYQISWSVNIGTTTAFIDTILYKNGSQFKRGQFSGSANAGGSVGSCLVYFNGSTDYVEVYFSQQSGGNQSIGNSSVTTYFQGSMVRGA